MEALNLPLQGPVDEWGVGTFRELLEMPLPGTWGAKGERFGLLSGISGAGHPLKVASWANPQLCVAGEISWEPGIMVHTFNPAVWR